MSSRNPITSTQSHPSLEPPSSHPCNFFAQSNPLVLRLVEVTQTAQMGHPSLDRLCLEGRIPNLKASAAFICHVPNPGLSANCHVPTRPSHDHPRIPCPTASSLLA
ncbi:hypothetical protein V2G26_008325 [Clonostachys chloroleuca]